MQDTDARYYVHVASGHATRAEAIHDRFERKAWRYIYETDEGALVVEIQGGEERRYLPEERVALSIEVE